MHFHRFTGAIAVMMTVGGLVTGVATAQVPSPSVPNAPQPGLAQPNLTQPNLATNGPAGTAVQTQTTRNLYRNGAEVDSSRVFKKSQSYSSGNGALSARTHIETTGSVTTVKPPSPSQEIPQ